ncbi:MAG: hypothetical protein CMK59_02900 [Proteobacteria bacterium]|nr:hypothetical protein [Pseudomonadota bacterium]
MLFFFACTTELIDTSSDHNSEMTPTADAGEDRYLEINKPALFSIESSTGSSFVWNFGDGNTYETTGENVEHSYAQAGSYPVVLTALTDDGRRHSDSSVVTVHHPRTETPARWSSLMQIHGDDIWFLFPEADALISMNISSGNMSTHQTCSNPQTISIYESEIGIVCQDNHTAQMFNLSGELIRSIELPFGSLPFGIVGSEDGWFISLSGTGELAWIEPSGELSIFSLGPDPRHITRLHDGTLAIPRFRSAQDGGSIYFWSPHTLETHTTFIDFDFGGDSDNTTGGIPNLLEHAIPSPDGKTIYLPFSHANILRGSYNNDQALTFESTLRGVLATLKQDEHGNWTEVAPRKQLDERGRSLTLAPNHYGDRLYLLHPGAEQISILDGINLQIRGSILDSGTTPMALIWSEEHQSLLLYSWLDRSIIGFELNENALTQSWKRNWTSVITEPLPEDILLGKHLFHSAGPKMSKAGYIACAHCHPDGTQDGLVWDFTDRGEGLRNTSSLLGSSQTGRFHWSGNFDEIQDFEGDIRNIFGGSGLMSDEDWENHTDPLGEPKQGLSTELDALAAYVNSLPISLPSPHPHSEAGALVFQEMGCQDCHPPPLFTDSSLNTPIRHDIGTLTQASGLRLGQPLDGLDTPSLLGVWNTAPYLHDGSANTLEEAVFKHQSIGMINEDEKSLLLSFLLSL